MTEQLSAMHAKAFSPPEETKPKEGSGEKKPEDVPPEDPVAKWFKAVGLRKAG
jgi:hypothetical protein